jgi:hypothetical protein
MDPSYQQLMIQQLMQGAPAGLNGQAPSTPQGAGFVTGNGMAAMPGNTMGASPGGMMMPGQPGMLGAPAPSQTMQQPMAAYPGMQPTMGTGY